MNIGDIYNRYPFIWTTIKTIKVFFQNNAIQQSHQHRIIAQYYKTNTSQLRLHNLQRVVIMMIDGRYETWGMADRLRACVGIYSLCKAKNIPFYINWNYPFDLKQFIEPNLYDWSINPETLVYEIPYSKPFVLFVNGKVWCESLLDKYIFLRKILKTNHIQYHIYSNVIINKSKWHDLFSELFRPSSILQTAIVENLQKIGSPYVSATFRFQQLLGDFREAGYPVLEKEQQLKLIDKCLKKLNGFVESIPVNYKVLVTSDSITFLEKTQENPRIYVIPGIVVHMSSMADNSTFLKSFLDFYLIMGAERVYLFQTGQMYNSGFPRFAAQVGKKPFVHYKF